LLTSVRGRTIKRAVLAGTLFGLAGLVKETAVLMGLIGAIWLSITGPRDKRIFAAMAMMLMTIAPALVWVARNSLHYGHLTGISNLGGLNLWNALVQREGVHGEGLIDSHDHDWTQGIPSAERARLDPNLAANGVDADRRLVELTRRHALEAPGHTLTRALRNVALFWSPVSRTVVERGFRGRPVEIISFVYFAIILLLFAVSLFWLRHRPETALVIAIVAITTAPHALVDASPRLRLGIEVLVVVFAAYPLAASFAPLVARQEASAPHR